jgi:ABC-type glycerol-3-phosphate transport system substrate-binding protein
MALPYSLELYGMFVRKDLIEEAGYKVSDLTTFDKLEEVVKAIAEIHDGVAWGLPYGNARAAAAQGGGIWMANGLWCLADFREEKRDAYIELLSLYKEVSKTLPEAAFTWDAGGFRRGFAEGVSAFIPIGQYYAPTLYNMAPDLVDPDKIAFIAYPSGPHGPGKPSLSFGATGLYLMKNTTPERKAMTVKFLKWLVDETDLLELCDSWPATRNPNWDTWLETTKELGYAPFLVEQVEEALDTAFFAERKLFPARSEVHEAFYLNILPLIKGEAEPEETYERLKEAIVPLILEVEPDYLKE